MVGQGSREGARGEKELAAGIPRSLAVTPARLNLPCVADSSPQARLL